MKLGKKILVALVIILVLGALADISGKDNGKGHTTVPSKETVTVDESTSQDAIIEEEKPQESKEPEQPKLTGIRPEFKKAMDSYEEFFDEYVKFMKKYSANPSDVSLLLKYAEMLGKYAEMTADFEKWEDVDMSDEELKYYLEVSLRVEKKLLEIM